MIPPKIQRQEYERDYASTLRGVYQSRPQGAKRLLRAGEIRETASTSLGDAVACWFTWYPTPSKVYRRWSIE